MRRQASNLAPERRALEREGRAAFRAGRRMPRHPDKVSGYVAERAAYEATIQRAGGIRL